MPIRVQPSSEPFTFGSETSPPILAECEAYRSLLASIVRYGKREIMGRSVLISGHRGSGKTTLVRWAVQQAQSRLRDDRTAARPLLVPLHGPDLLGGESVLATNREARQEAVSARKQSKKQRRPRPSAGDQTDSDTRAALRMLTEALHRAYVAELGRALVAQTAGDESLHELAAQLIVELDHAPDLDALRFIWQRAGKLKSGVLFPPAAPPLRDNQQGYRELLAASAVIEAYRRVAGKLEGVEGSSRQSEFSEKAESKSDWSGKDFFNPLAGLLAGGVAGAGVLMSGTGGAARPLAAALAGIVTAVGGTAVLNYSSSRSRKTSRESSLTFTWDTSIASLDRMLPVMVERIVDAGLAPIFVVDELDKVPDIEDKMEHLIRHLKHLVTEKTFFCFLTDRSYFEHVVASSRTKVYGKEYTFFSDRLFVHYSPRDMHKYLFDILSRDSLTDNEQLDRSVLPFLLLERSKMHPIDLRRALSDLTDETAAITLPVGTVRQPEGYGMAVLVQAAVEVALDQPDLRSRLSQDPNFARIAYDALYLPARSWENGDDKLVLKREALKAALESRMADEYHTGSNPRNLSEADLDLLHASVKRLAGYLRQPQTLVQLLANPTTAAADASSKHGDEYKTYQEAQRNAVREVVPITEVLLGEEDAAETSRWLRDPFGRPRPEPVAVAAPAAATPAVEMPEASVPVPEPAVEKQVAAAAAAAAPASPVLVVPQQPPQPPVVVPSAPQRPPTADRIVQIRALNTFIRSVSGQRLDLDKLATQIHLLGISPAWPSVDNAIRAFENAGPSAGATDPAMQSHQSLIESYAQMFDASYGAIRRALMVATLMTLPMRGSAFPRLLERALRLLAADLRFAKTDIQETNNRLKACEEQARKIARNINAPVDEVLAIPEWDLGTWHEKLSSWMTAAFANRVMLAGLDTATHLRLWRIFLIGHLRGGSSIFYPNLNDLLLRGADLAMPFPPDWNEVACLDCAKALRMTQIETEPLLRETILVELGFAQQVAGMLPTVNVPPDALELLEICLSPPVQRTGDRVLLVIGGAAEQRRESPDGDAVILVEEAAGSMAAGWRLSAQHAVLPLFAPQFVETTARSAIFPKLNLTWILHEPPLPPLPGLTIRGIFRLVLAGSPATPDAIVGPASLDAAVDEMRKRSSRASVA